MASTKSFDIAKQLVWRAYQRVRANKGAAGIDSVSMSTDNSNTLHLSKILKAIFTKYGTVCRLAPICRLLSYR